MKTTKTLEQLANHFGSKVWKDSRVYLPQFGYKTKKMNTTTYIYIQDSEIKVSVFTECPSQPYQWIQKQNEICKQRVFDALEEMEQELATETYGSGHNEVMVERNTPPVLVAEKMEADLELVK